MNKNWPYLTATFLASFGVFAAVAISFLVNGRQVPLFAVSLMLLSLGLLAVAMVNIAHETGWTVFATQQKKSLRELRIQYDLLADRMATVEKRDSDEDVSLAELKATYAALKDSMVPAANAQTAYAEEPRAPDAAPVVDSDVQFALEPMVDIPTRRTAHYRLHPSLPLNGALMFGDALREYCEVNNLQTELDVEAVRESLRLLGRLRQRDPMLSVLCPIGIETFTHTDAVRDIISACDTSPDDMRGLVLEVPHEALAAVTSDGFEGLARLARRGIGFALSDVMMEGLDLDAMKTLNVRFVGLTMQQIGHQGPEPHHAGFAQRARVARINVYVTGIDSADQIPLIASVARLACGPCFAEPRLVKRVVSPDRRKKEAALRLVA